jgi:hypothetical protein
MQRNGSLTLFTQQNIERIKNSFEEDKIKKIRLSNRINQLNDDPECQNKVFYKYKAVSQSTMHLINRSRTEV